MMDGDIGSAASKLASLLRDSVRRACGTSGVVGVLFSGGVDSSVVAVLASEFADVRLYCAGAGGAEDVRFAAEMSGRLNLPLRTFNFTLEDAKEAVDALSEKIGNDRMQLGIALPFFFSTRLALEDGLGFVLTGNGADELFGGYSRYLKVPLERLNETLKRDFIALEWKDVKRDRAASAVEVRYPYLDPEVVGLSLSIPAGLKINGGKRKAVLREVGKLVGLPPEITEREKKACQYGSGADKLLGKILLRK